MYKDKWSNLKYWYKLVLHYATKMVEKQQTLLTYCKNYKINKIIQNLLFNIHVHKDRHSEEEESRCTNDKINIPNIS